jgi:hypothetical protein
VTVIRESRPRLGKRWSILLHDQTGWSARNLSTPRGKNADLGRKVRGSEPGKRRYLVRRAVEHLGFLFRNAGDNMIVAMPTAIACSGIARHRSLRVRPIRKVRTF